MAHNMKPRFFMLVLLMIPAALASAVAFQEKSSQAPTQKDPTKLPARDAHQDLLVAADPWVTAEEYKPRFPKDCPFDYGIMAIDVYFKNDGALPVRINLATIRLTITHERSANEELPPLSSNDVANYMLGGKGNGKNPTKRSRLPIPIHPSDKNAKKVQELADALHAVQLQTDLVPPHSTVRGLLYFDMDGHFEWTATARLYVPDLKTMGTDKTLLFFDVDLSAAVEQ
jgi:hypothetical protein